MKTIFLTGGTGSFGQGFVRMLLGNPDIQMVRVFSRDEHKQRLMRQAFPHDRVSFFIGDVRDKERLKRAMDGCDWVVHAAALKQAPLGEIEPQEFIKTNILGTMNVIEAALDCNVEKAIFISTDKAVEPINLYGATKMCSEKMWLQADVTRGSKQTRFSFTRYGNVANTAGSVIPLFRGLPDDEDTPVTDPMATRFWITLDQANQFVYNSLKNMEGGETFIPQSKSVRVIDIAKAIRPHNHIKYIGLRKGDKLHEVLYVNHETGDRLSSDRNDFITQEEIGETLSSAKVS